MSLDKIVAKFFRTKKRKAFNKINVYTDKKSIQKWFPIDDIDEEYILLKDDYIVVTYEIKQSASNFMSKEDMQKIAKKNTEQLSKINVEYSFLSLVKSKDMSAYTNFIAACMQKENITQEKELGLHKLVNYVNNRVADNDFSTRGHYLVFSTHIDDIQGFSEHLNYLKREFRTAGIVLNKLDKQEQINVLYTYFNPDVNIDNIQINSYSKFFA